MKLTDSFVLLLAILDASGASAVSVLHKRVKKIGIWMCLATAANAASSDDAAFPFEILALDSQQDPAFMDSWYSKSAERRAYLAGLEDLKFELPRKAYAGAQDDDKEKRLLRDDSDSDSLRSVTLKEYRKLRQAVHYANVAFCQAEGVELWTCSRCQHADTRGAKEVMYFHGKETDSVGYVAANMKQKQIVVSYRGSKTLKNWVQNLKFAQVDTHWPRALNNNDVKVHKGFYETFTETNAAVMEKLFELIQEHPRFSVLFTGHSLGGALATLATLEFMERAEAMGRKVTISLITVSSPRLGNAGFTQYFKQKAIAQDAKLFRIVHQHDIVPHLPPLTFGFRHLVTESWIEKKDTYPLLCSSTNGEDDRCSNSLDWPLNIGHHLEACGIPMGGDDC